MHDIAQAQPKDHHVYASDKSIRTRIHLYDYVFRVTAYNIDHDTGYQSKDAVKDLLPVRPLRIIPLQHNEKIKIILELTGPAECP